MRELTFTQAIREATIQSLDDPNVYVMGLGVSYPKGADGTTEGLAELFPDRIIDTPVSEDAVTGVAVGTAINGMKPIMHHGRVEFALFALDQIATQAAKWNYMFGGGNPCPIVFRICVGRQWGNGPQHTQSLPSLFGAIPGLKVVVPSTPERAKGLLNAAVQDKNPVVFLEPRWCYGLKGEVPEEYYTYPLDSGYFYNYSQNSIATVVTYGDGIIEAKKANDFLKQFGEEIDIYDLVTLKYSPYNIEMIGISQEDVKPFIFFETCNESYGVGNEIIASLTKKRKLTSTPHHIACPNTPCPTATSLTKQYYPTWQDIVLKLKPDLIMPDLSFEELNFAPKITV